jgi:hypothetical protein
MNRDEVFDLAVECGFPGDRLCNGEVLDVFEKIVSRLEKSKHAALEEIKNEVAPYLPEGDKPTVAEQQAHTIYLICMRWLE